MGLTIPGSHARVDVIHLLETRQVTADIAAAAGAYWIAPYRCRVIGAVGHCAAIGGGTEFTDLDLDVQKATTTVLEGVMPVVNSSAIVKTTAASHKGPSATVANTLLNVGDVLNLDIDTTGGSTPTADGVGAYVFVVPEESDNT